MRLRPCICLALTLVLLWPPSVAVGSEADELKEAAEDEGPIGQVSQPLVLGDLVDPAEQQRLGLLTIPGCSASLLSNDWALTAAHCITRSQLTNPSSLGVMSAWTSGSIPAEGIYSYWGYGGRQGGAADLALIKLSAPMRVNGATTGFKAQWLDAVAQLENANARAYGRGISSLARVIGGVPQPAAIDGRFRRADFVVKGVDQDFVRFDRTRSGAIIAGGDSGGPTYDIGPDGELRLIGVHSSCSGVKCLPGQSCTDEAGDFSWNWVSEIQACYDAPAYRHQYAFRAIQAQPWGDPSKTAVETVAVSGSEAWAQPLIITSRPDLIADFGATRRMATRACENRGYETGFMFRHDEKPGSPADERVADIVCLSALAGQWIDVSLADVAATSAGFEHLQTASWTQGARAATAICSSTRPGSVGGLFSGFTGVAGADLMGVFCLTADIGTRAVSLSSEQLAIAGPVEDANWLVAAGAANEACKRRGHPGGFLSGTSTADGISAVCVSRGRELSEIEKGGFGTGQAGAYPHEFIYARRNDGLFFRYVLNNATAPGGPRAGASGNLWEGSNENTGVFDWNYQRLFSAGSGLYGVRADGELFWHRPGENGGWLAGPTVVGSGWADFKHVFGGGDNVIYAIDKQGELFWYKHVGATDGLVEWQGPNLVGSGWGDFPKVFSAGAGEILAVRSDGKLFRWHHLGHQTGEATWEVYPDGAQYQEIGQGWGHFKEVFAGHQNGVVYAVNPAGELFWYRVGYRGPSVSKFSSQRAAAIAWEGPVRIAEGWQIFTTVFVKFPAIGAIGGVR